MGLTLEPGERLLSLKEALPFLPPRRRLGRLKPPSTQTVAAWIRVGFKGQRLEAVRVGQRTYATTRSACERFSTAVAASRASRRTACATKQEPDPEG